MKICTNCGARFDDNVNFCGNCGGRLGESVPDDRFKESMNEFVNKAGVGLYQTKDTISAGMSRIFEAGKKKNEEIKNLYETQKKEEQELYGEEGKPEESINERATNLVNDVAVGLYKTGESLHQKLGGLFNKGSDAINAVKQRNEEIKELYESTKQQSSTEVEDDTVEANEV